MNSARTAFSILELLVVITLIGVLTTILLPTLAVVRERSDELACLSNGRQVGLLLIVYAGESDDLFPTMLGSMSEVRANPEVHYQFAMQSRFLWSYSEWHDWAGMPHLDTIYQCVADPGDDEGKPPEEVGGTWTIASAAYTADKFFDDAVPDDEWLGKFPGQLRRHYEVRYPAEKVMHFESDIYHAWVPEDPLGDGHSLGIYGTHGRGAVCMMDGSGRLAGKDDNSAFIARSVVRWPSGRFDSPLNGMAGRDFLPGGWLNAPDGAVEQQRP